MFRKQFHFVVTFLKSIGHGYPQNNLEPLCIEDFALSRRYDVNVESFRVWHE
jgi:hypothetical protein